MKGDNKNSERIKENDAHHKLCREGVVYFVHPTSMTLDCSVMEDGRLNSVCKHVVDTHQTLCREKVAYLEDSEISDVKRFIGKKTPGACHMKE